MANYPVRRAWFVATGLVRAATADTLRLIRRW
jgi:hypothetical protein